VISVKRAYDPASKSDGRRFLVDRLWPRGVKKETLKVEAWLKTVAPSKQLLTAAASRRAVDHSDKSNVTA
jgi:uncharacterized protein YeaO (DUF488 family)